MPAAAASDEDAGLMDGSAEKWPPRVDPESTAERVRRARVSVGKLYLSIQQEDQVNVESGSIYGSALVMPQIARSAGWPPRLVFLCLRTYIFLAVNVFLQWMLVYSLMKEEQVMDKFSGQMWICDFAAQKRGCPEAAGCIGPGGTRITPSRLYSFTQWNTRGFVKAALASVFPDRIAEIGQKVDPGEYGLESMHCRYLCTFLFIVAVTQEFKSVCLLFRLLWRVPSAADSWVIHADADDEVSLKVCGMPRFWKAINIIAVALPKLMLWQFIARTGMIFLIETASIENTIVNSTALTFILNIDELFFDVFATAQTKHMLEKLEGFRIHQKHTSRPDSSAKEQEQAILDKSGVNTFVNLASIPWMPLVSVVVWTYFIWVYYSSHCFKSEDGTYVSQPMFLPTSTDFGQMSAFLPQMFPIPAEKEPYWTYTERSEA